MTHKSFAVFDMDGTLVDSMHYWKGLATEYLTKKGISEIPADLLERIKPMTMTESAALFIETFGLPGTPEQVAEEMNGMMNDHYRGDVPLKEGVTAYLQALKASGVSLCVASATAQPLMEDCLTRLGVADAFDFLLSCEEVGAGKDRPEVYLEAARRLGAEPGDIAVYEDACYALKTAKNAGFYCVGVYDEGQSHKWEALRAVADAVITDWTQAAKALR